MSVQKTIKPFTSKLLDSKILDMVNNITISNFKEVKEQVVAYAANHMNDKKHALIFQSKNTPNKLREAVWSYIMVSTGNKVIK